MNEEWNMSEYLEEMREIQKKRYHEFCQKMLHDEKYIDRWKND